MSKNHKLLNVPENVKKKYGKSINEDSMINTNTLNRLKLDPSIKVKEDTNGFKILSKLTE